MQNKIEMLSLEQLLPNPYERRQQDTNIDSLASSMERNGLIYPIIVREYNKKAGNAYEVADGGRRVKAARSLGWTEIKAIIEPLDDNAMQTYATVANLQRESLSMWEEVAEVQFLVDRKTQTIPQIAEHLGKPISWVGKRYRISQTPAPVLKRIKEQFPRLELPSLCELCTLEANTLSEIITENINWRLRDVLETNNLPELKKLLQTIQHKLNTAPWNLADAELLPAAGACTMCPHRSGRNPSLFDQLEESKTLGKNETCLNAKCWQEKREAHTQNLIEQAKTKYPNLVLVCDNYDSKFPRPHHFQKCKKTDNGAFPALHVNDEKAGQLIWLKPYEHQKAEKKPAKSMAQLSEKERETARRETLGQKRARVFVRLVKKHIDELQVTPKHSLALLLTFGSSANNTEIDDDEDTWKTFNVYARGSDKTIDERAWKLVKDVITARLTFTGTLDQIQPYYDDAMQLCATLELSAKTFTDAAVKEIPTPKALQRADANAAKAPKQKAAKK